MVLPLEYRWLRAHGLQGLTPWWFLDDEERVDGLRAEYLRETGGRRDMLPFATRQDDDDMAGFVLEDEQITGYVIVVHLTWTGKKERPGYPRETKPMTFRRFMEDEVMRESFEWISEEQLARVTT